MRLENGVDVLVADTADSFAAAYLQLVRQGALWNSLSDNAVENVRSHFSAEAARDALRRAIL
jgi:glycosyltransferase involved in cell wall biosynthesis